MALLRAAVRLVSFALLVVLSLAGLALAVFAVVGLTQLAELAGLKGLRGTVGGFLASLEAGGPVAVAAALAGLGAMLLGLLLLAGILVPRRERLVTLTTSDEGTIAARRRSLAQVAKALAEQVRGVTEAKAKVRSRRGGGGSVRVTAVGTRPSDAGALEGTVGEQLEPLTEPFRLKARVSIRQPGGRGARVQ